MPAIYVGMFLDQEFPSEDEMRPFRSWSGKAEDPRDAARKVFLATKDSDGQTLQISHRMHGCVPVGIFHRKDSSGGETMPAMSDSSSP